MGGKGGGGNKAPDWLKQSRREQQQRDIDIKTENEIRYFWDLQEQNKKRDAERGGPPRKGRKFLEDEHNELFEKKAGMTMGIDFEKYDDIEVEVTGFGVNELKFLDSFAELSAEFKFAQFLDNNIWNCHYTKPTPVQKHSIPVVCSGRDLMACAQTGSGKTAAFLIPLAARLMPEYGCEAQRITWEGAATPMSVVLAPTRELCSQIYDEARKIFHRSPFKVSQCYGGVEVKPQLRDMSRGCDVVLATPGRLTDFINRGIITMEWVSLLILDEADRMLDMGFEPQIREIVENQGMPDKNSRLTMMFSATFPKEIQKLAQNFLKDNYMFISVGRVGHAAEEITQMFEPIYSKNDDDKMPIVQKKLDTLQGLKANNAYSNGYYGGNGGIDKKKQEKVIIFVGMKRTATWLSGALYRYLQINTAEIHGDLSQAEREKSLDQFKSGDRPVLVATDVASRGLDIPKVALVINWDLPSQIDDYVHRIGRTGRLGNRGEALSLVRLSTSGAQRTDQDLCPDLCQILNDAKKDIPDWLESEAWGSKNKRRYDVFAQQLNNRGGGKGGKGKGGGGYGGGYGNQDFEDDWRNPRSGNADFRNHGSSGVYRANEGGRGKGKGGGGKGGKGKGGGGKGKSSPKGNGYGGKDGGYGGKGNGGYVEYSDNTYGNGY